MQASGGGGVHIIENPVILTCCGAT